VSAKKVLTIRAGSGGWVTSVEYSMRWFCWDQGERHTFVENLLEHLREEHPTEFQQAVDNCNRQRARESGGS
jgi:hypothetical protein